MVPLRTDTAWTPSPEDTPWARLGGSDAVRALVHAFYDAMEAWEPALAKVHRLDEQGRIPPDARERLALFLIHWLGGPSDYLELHGHPRLRMRHGKVPVGVELRDAWTRCMTRALDARGVEGPVRSYLDGRFAHVADFLRNVEG